MTEITVSIPDDLYDELLYFNKKYNTSLSHQVQVAFLKSALLSDLIKKEIEGGWSQNMTFVINQMLKEFSTKEESITVETIKDYLTNRKKN